MARDLRKYASQTNFRLVVGGLLLLFIIGDGLIYYFYGKGAAVLRPFLYPGRNGACCFDCVCYPVHGLDTKANRS